MSAASGGGLPAYRWAALHGGLLVGDRQRGMLDVEMIGVIAQGAAWTGQAMVSYDALFADAGAAGISVYVAAGDDGANDQVDDTGLHVDFPASSPKVVGCGGTRPGAAEETAGSTSSAVPARSLRSGRRSPRWPTNVAGTHVRTAAAASPLIFAQRGGCAHVFGSTDLNRHRPPLRPA